MFELAELQSRCSAALQNPGTYEQTDVMDLTPVQCFRLESIARSDHLADAFGQTRVDHPGCDLATGPANFVRLGVLTKG